MSEDQQGDYPVISGDPLDPRLGKDGVLTLVFGLAGQRFECGTFRFDTETLWEFIRALVGAPDGFTVSDQKRGKVSASGAIAQRAMYAVQQRFSALAALLLNRSIETAIEEARLWWNEIQADADAHNSVTNPMLWGRRVAPMPPKMRTSFIKSVESDFRKTLTENQRGGAKGPRPLKPVEKKLIAAFDDLMSAGKSKAEAARILMSQFPPRKNSDISIDPIGALTKRYERLKKRAARLLNS